MADCAQECKDCEGLGEWACYGKAYFCKTCDGTGEIERTGPYRLADGTWSDGVNREKRIYDRDPAIGRVDVRKSRAGEVWLTTTDDEVDHFSTWHEAYDHADRMARTNQGENNE